MDVIVGEQTYIDGIGTVNVYQNETVGGQSGDVDFAVPQENMNASQWTVVDTGGVTFIPSGPSSNAPSIMVVNARFPGSDYYQTKQSYENAYREVSGQAPTPGVWWFIYMPFIVKLLIAAMLVVAAIVIAVVVINASTINSVEKMETTDGSDLYKTCIGNLFGGVECYMYNATTNKTSKVGGIVGIGDLLKYGIIAIGVIGAVYIGVKLVAPALSKRSSGYAEGLDRVR